MRETETIIRYEGKKVKLRGEQEKRMREKGEYYSWEDEEVEGMEGSGRYISEGDHVCCPISHLSCSL